MRNRTSDRIVQEVIVNTGIDELWDAWVAEEGVKSFLAPLKYRFSTGPSDWNNPPKLQ